ncbi:hypothetical protein EV144_1011438 [Flavobacterium sp. 270]|uniref:hypothetical protein n=1 Tax=Flavobacterium sp. 270 TaxID=2512114 RepID=UPI001067055E|nr:hypothetical protein [Flavobacterium sp. 270]TDW52745.1 hypothetical protein EV144_1011438 [Flavobacterium sp. 270]
MIRNYDELVIYIAKIEKQIPKLKAEQQKHIYNLNFRNAKTTLAKRQFIELQILNYIGYYQEKIKNHHLENKLYGSKLSCIKMSYQTKTMTNDLIYCLQQLMIECDELKNDLWIFSVLDSYYCLAIKDKRKKIIFKMEEIYFELANTILFSDEKVNAKQIYNYNLIVDFFSNYYISAIENLEEKFRHKKSDSNFIQSLAKLFNAPTIKMKQFKSEIEKETEETTNQLNSLVKTKERFEQLNRIVLNHF